MCQILAYVYLVEYKAVLFSVFSDYQCRPPFYGIGHASPTACWVGISGSGYAIVMHVIRRRLRVERLKVQPGHTAEGLTKATACDKPAASVSLAVQPSSACPCPYRVKGHV